MSLLDLDDSFFATLADLLAGKADLAFQRARDDFETPTGNRELVIFGVGALGKLLFESARLAGFKLLAFADNDPTKWDSTLDGVPVMSPEMAIERFNTEATFLVGIFNSSAPRRQLAQLGCRRVARYPAFAWHFPAATQFVPHIVSPTLILKHSRELIEAYSTLSDHESRREFAGQVGWRCSLDDRYLLPHLPLENIYFDREIAPLGSREVVYDCGAFDGDSLRAILGIVPTFRRYYAFEPDPANGVRLAAYVSSLKRLARRVCVLPFALGDSDQDALFDAGHGAGSGFDPMATERVVSKRLDGIDAEEPTVIKMDIEGAELDALRGASETICNDRPILAIAAYHFGEHLWQIPNLIRAIVPDYHIFFRRYAEECWETVFYGVPPERRSFHRVAARSNVTGAEPEICR